MIRYCLTEKHKLVPCAAGWVSYASVGVKSCFDEPQEENCRYLVDEKTHQACPYCGNILGTIQRGLDDAGHGRVSKIDMNTL